MAYPKFHAINRNKKRTDTSNDAKQKQLAFYVFCKMKTNNSGGMFGERFRQD